MASLEQRAFGQMALRSWALYAINRPVVAALRTLSPISEKGFIAWKRLVWALGPKVVGRTYYGAAIECDLRDYILQRIFFFGVWEPSVSKAISDILRPGDLFVDIGANVGYDTLLASRLVGAAGSVVAIEAGSNIFAQLQANLARNGVTNVRPVRVAVGDSVGELTLHGGDAGNQGRTSLLPREGLHPIEVVALRPLDEILNDEERRRVRLIKMDIEGGEPPVLQRLVRTLDKYDRGLHLIVEMSEGGGADAEAVFGALLEHGFRAFALENDYSIASYLRSTRAAEPVPIRSLPKSQTDVLFVPSGAHE